MKERFAPRIDGTKQEKIYERPSEYSKWHRTLGKDCLACDIDFVEYRLGRGVVGFIATTSRFKDEEHMINSKKYVWQRTSIERKILKELSEASDVPAYFVFHLDDLSIFHVHNPSNNDLKTFIRMNKDEYSDFVKGL